LPRFGWIFIITSFLANRIAMKILHFGLMMNRIPHSPDLDEFATLPKLISFRPKPEWTSDSYNCLPNVKEETNACWIVVGRDETLASAVNRPQRPDTVEMKDLQGTHISTI
jgi:hypothetical protein